MRLTWSEIVLFAHGEILGARSKDRSPQCLRHIPQTLILWREGSAIIENYRRAECERAHEPVPHHPTAGREIENTIMAFDVRLQPVLLEMLQQRAASAVHHALGKAGGAGRIKNVERVIERQPSEGQLRRFGVAGK